MASGLSAIYDQGLLKYSLGFATTNLPATPAAIGISLHTTSIGTNKVSTGEWVSAGAANTNYTARASVGINTASWTVAAFAASGVSATNAAQVAFFGTGLTGTGNSILAVAIQDSLTVAAGNLLWFQDVTSVAIATGIIVQFNIGDISLLLL